MENDCGGRDSEGTAIHEPTGAEARATLDAMDTDATQLAERLVTPWWYHALLGAAVALAIGSLMIPQVHPAAVIPFVVIWMPVMLTAYTSRWGVAAPRAAGRRSRRALLLCLAVLGVIVAFAVLLPTTALSPWWGALPAAAGCGATVVLGRHRDAVLRSEVANLDLHR